MLSRHSSNRSRARYVAQEGARMYLSFLHYCSNRSTTLSALCRSWRALSNQQDCILFDVCFFLRQIEEDPDSEETKDLSWLLYETALTASGFTVNTRMFRVQKSGSVFLSR